MHANTIRISSVIVILLIGPTLVAGRETSAVATPLPPAPLATVHVVGSQVSWPDWVYIITHGMGGTIEGDRFELLAREIKARFPQANVYRVDWSAASSKKVLGILTPWLVAPSVAPVARIAAEQLRPVVDPQRLTLIGESFGNDVNHAIAAELGRVARILSFNPANELGGRGASDLRRHSDQTWAFHTRSVFDTRLAVSHRGLLLHTPHGYDAVQQHTYGIRWLRDSIADGDVSWLAFEREIPPGVTGMYDAAVFADGAIDWEPLPRQPVNHSAGESR